MALEVYPSISLVHLKENVDATQEYETKCTCLKDTQFPGAQQRTGKTDTRSIIKQNILYYL